MWQCIRDSGVCPFLMPSIAQVVLVLKIIYIVILHSKTGSHANVLLWEFFYLCITGFNGNLAGTKVYYKHVMTVFSTALT